VVGAAGGQLLHVRREQDPGDVLLVRGEVGHGHQLGPLEGLDELPDEDIALWQLVLQPARSQPGKKKH
jgi:hypothetical protein